MNVKYIKWSCELALLDDDHLNFLELNELRIMGNLTSDHWVFNFWSVTFTLNWFIVIHRYKGFLNLLFSLSWYLSSHFPRANITSFMQWLAIYYFLLSFAFAIFPLHTDTSEDFCAYADVFATKRPSTWVMYARFVCQYFASATRSAPPVGQC